MYDVKSAINDFGDDILFIKIGDHFGDSPDGLAYINDDPFAVIEIKCPSNKKKAANQTLEKTLASDVVNERRHQIIGHFIGNPNIDEVWLIIYNAHIRSNGIPYNRGRIFVFNRKDFEPSISLMEAKIEKVYRFILLCVEGKFKPEDINSWWITE